MFEDNQAALAGENNAEEKECLYMAMELSLKKWKLAFRDGKGTRARLVTIEAKDWEGLRREIGKARERFGMKATGPVRSCYEAGREGFWIHRALEEKGIQNVVVDAASIERNRRAKQVKTDRIDAEKLVGQLMRYWRGDRGVWSVIRIPSPEAEDGRQLHRDMEVLKAEKREHRTRIQSLLFTQGIDGEIGHKFLEKLEAMRCWNGRPVPEQMKERLRREYERLRMVERDLLKLKTQQAEEVKKANTPALEKVRFLQQLCGIGMTSSWVFVMEFFAWRKFRNRREVAGAVGITPMPYQSGESAKEQGINHAGNRRIRTMAVEIAWSWLRLQPQSQLSRWYRKRFGSGGARMRKIGIVAMARRLVIDLWRYLERGVVPEGARLKVC